MSNQKKRNFQIEAFKHRVVVDPKYADKTWKILEHAIHEIYNHNASGLSFEELYRLGRMYNLFRRVPNGLLTIREVMTSHLRETGKQVVTDPERLKDPVEFVQRLLDEKDKYDSIISLAFNNDKTFQNALNSSFEYLLI
ncbi:hypothetical protein GH714_036121 [Hevea brasiliensis]|uniref:Cullin N-terminal domain-containing protein n=1 Tax=Hevea brasiliensis TaxID=3981 RepID=A0A6A6LLU9_HEVBR|nr:hypothetical protein GH714_036121 [Hevea brasiliensis]